jgi:acetylornithine deacetylase/succinyl-diaminopimelate desuccinylase-like protein
MTYELWYSNAPSFNALGAKAVNYGPSGGKRLEGLSLSDKDREYINFEDLYNCTKVYANLISQIVAK